MERGLVTTQVDPTGQFLEYWIYQDKTSGYIDGKTGEYAEGTVKIESGLVKVLKCVFVCENDPSHIIKDMPNHIVVKGFKFDDVDYPDLTDYLGRTERHL